MRQAQGFRTELTQSRFSFCAAVSYRSLLRSVRNLDDVGFVYPFGKSPTGTFAGVYEHSSVTQAPRIDATVYEVQLGSVQRHARNGVSSAKQI